jgi:hypothetical protein
MLTGNTLVFDIETVPDIDLGSRIWNLSGITGDEQVKAMQAKRLEKTGYSDFLAHHMQKIVSISAAFRNSDSFRIWSIGDVSSSEKELLERFFQGIEKYDPVLVSWNGSGFDLPVIQYRSLANSVAAPHYWEVGDKNHSFRYNNFINRFHWRHIDLMDVLSGFQPRAGAPLHEIALLLKLPGKLGMNGSDVWNAYRNGQIEEIRNYCETDVLNTYIIYLHFEHIRGNLTEKELSDELNRVSNKLTEKGTPHLLEFLEQWQLSRGEKS